MTDTSTKELPINELLTRIRSALTETKPALLAEWNLRFEDPEAKLAAVTDFLRSLDYSKGGSELEIPYELVEHEPDANVRLSILRMLVAPPDRRLESHRKFIEFIERLMENDPDDEVQRQLWNLVAPEATVGGTHVSSVGETWIPPTVESDAYSALEHFRRLAQFAMHNHPSDQVRAAAARFISEV